jgi:hypothetical protein
MTDKSKLGCPADTKSKYAQSCVRLAAFLLAAVLDTDGLSGELAAAEN